MKLYIHAHTCEQSQATADQHGLESVRAPFTVVIQPQKTTTVHKIIELMEQLHAQQYAGVAMETRPTIEFGLYKSKKSHPLDPATCISALMCNGDDLYLKPLPACQELTSQSETSTVTQMTLDIANRFIGEGQLDKARDLHLEAVAADSNCQEALQSLCEIYLTAERPEKGLEYAQAGRAAHPHHLPFTFLEGRCLVASGQLKLGIKILMEYTRKLRQTDVQLPAKHKHEVQMALCAAYRAMDQDDMAIVMVEGVLREEGFHAEARCEYARLTYDLNEEKSLEATTTLLSLLVQDRKNKRVQRYLAEVSQKENGLKTLEKACGDAWNDISALVLLALTLRDHGALSQCGTLLLRTVSLDPSHVTAVLAYTHHLEVLCQYQEAFEAITCFLSNHPDLGVGHLTCEHITKVTQCLTGNIHFSACSPVEPVCVAASAVPVTYSQAELDLLALWFTLVKILYHQGALAVLPNLVKILDILYTGKNLHKTSICNEAAYFACVAALVRGWTEVPQLTLGEEFVYILGDSHSLSAAWGRIKYRGNHTRLHPLLSTGTKLWHLRKKSQFYPKRNFYHTCELVPAASTVIVVLGEIDCREGLLPSVHKCRYDTLEEGVEALLDIYTEVLTELRQRGHVVYVHPVPPVLSPTRVTVSLFNERLKARFLPGGSLHTTGSSSNTADIQYLDFVDDLLASDGNNIKKEFSLDGTHLHPSYIRLIEAAL